jgi:CxxC-x17-CxxC domain-containing protein
VNFQDKTLTCRDCGQPFTFTASEQQFYASKGFDNEPTRCPSCRAKHKAARMGDRGNFRGGDRGSRQMFTVTCAECGKETTVPFQPKGDRPVYCRECFDKRRAEGLDQPRDFRRDDRRHEDRHEDASAPMSETSDSDDTSEQQAA